MKSFQGKSGLLAIAALSVFVLLGAVIAKNMLTVKTATATSPTRPNNQAPATKPAEEPRLVTKFVSVVVDPFARPMPGETAVAQEIPNQIEFRPANSTPVHTVPSGGPVALGPLRITPDSMPGELPSGGAPTTPEGQPASTQAPPAPPIRIGVNGVVGARGDRAFVSVGGSAPRPVRAGSDLGDGVTVVRVTESGVVLRRGSQTQTVPVGKEIEL